MAVRERRAVLLVSFVASLGACISLEGLRGGEEIDSLVDASPETAAPAEDGSVSDGADEPSASPADRYREAILADRPLAYWRLDETSGTTAKDEKGAHPGVYELAPTLGSTGIFGTPGAVELPSATNAHVRIPGTDFSFGGVASYSVELWVKPKAFHSFDWLVSTEVTPPRLGWSVLVGETGEVLYEVWRPNDAGGPEVRSLSSKKSLVLDRFQHVVVTYNGAMMRVYIDGKLDNANPAPRDAPDDGVLLLGCRRNADGTVSGCVDGWTLDEVAIYDFPLTDTQVFAHYEAGKPRT